MEQGILFVSKDFIKHRPHIHYLMKHCGKNSVGVIATYNSQKKTITLREDAFELCSVAEDFVRLSLEDEMNTRTPNESVDIDEVNPCFRHWYVKEQAWNTRTQKEG